VIFVVGRKVNMLSKVKGGQKRQKLRGEVTVLLLLNSEQQTIQFYCPAPSNSQTSI